MTQSYWPFAGVKATETQFSQYNRRMQMSGVWGNPGDQTLRIVAGVGLGLTLKPGYAFVRGHMYYSDADVAVTISAADAQARIDLVVLRLNPTANTISPVVIKGNPAASNPLEPSPITTDAANYDIPIAAVYVAGGASSLNASNLTDRRIFAALQWGVWETQSRPGTTLNPGTPRTGQAGMNTQLGYPEFWDGDSWEPFKPLSLDPSTISGTVPISKGGTGSSTAAAARAALGVTPANIGAASLSHGHDLSDITTGGTFLSNWLEGRYAQIDHYHDISRIFQNGQPIFSNYLPNTYATKVHEINSSHTGILSVSRGGTGQSSLLEARWAMGITYGTPAASGGSEGSIYLRVL